MGNAWQPMAMSMTSSPTTLNEDNLAIEPCWQEFKVGNKIDYRDHCGKWYEAVIQRHKPANEPMHETFTTNKRQKERKIFEPLEAIYIHYISDKKEHDQWVFITNHTICNCCTTCGIMNHVIAAPNVQTRYNSYNKNLIHENIGNTTAASIGLVNIGNTGWMSNIHCLGSIDHFRTYFVSGQYKLDINESDEFGCKGELAHEFAKLLSDVWSDDIHNSISPQSFKHILGKCYPNFNGCKLQ
eukprot:114658_1